MELLQSGPKDATAPDMASAMQLRDFDVAGVRERRGSALLGFVIRGELTEGMVSDHLHPIVEATLVADSTALGDLFRILSDQAYAFVLIGDCPDGIVTRVDFNKPPVRAYLFGLVSLLEMHLDYWVHSWFPGDSWENELAAGRLEAAKTLLGKRRRVDATTTLFQCLQFCDKNDLLVSKPGARSELGLPGKAKTASMLRRAEELRNNLAHSQPSIVGSLSWPELIGVVTRVETLIDRSDELIESRAKTATTIEPTLW